MQSTVASAPTEVEADGLRELRVVLIKIWNLCVYKSRKEKCISRRERASSEKKVFKEKSSEKGKSCVANSYQFPPMFQDLLIALDCLEEKLSHEALQEAMVLLEVMTFQVRDCRKEGFGKGVRLHSWLLFQWLANKCPKTAAELLPLYPKYGYWKDFNELLVQLHQQRSRRSQIIIDSEATREALRDRIVELYATQLVEDHGKLQEYQHLGKKGDGNPRRPQLTLAGKWAPRIHKHFDRTCQAAKLIALKVYSIQYPDEYVRYLGVKGNETEELPIYIRIKTYYRKMVVALTAFLEVVETKLQKGTYSSIDFDCVSGWALQRYRKAMMNQSLEIGAAARWPEDEDRKRCAEQFAAFIAAKMKKKNNKKSALKGHSVLLPTLIANAAVADAKDDTHKAMLALQFEDHKKVLQRAAEEGKADFGNGIVLADVSGSMEGTPMNLSIAMALLISSLAKGPWHGKFITFSESPEFIQIDESLTFVDAVKFVKGTPWGSNTDFIKVFDMILSIAVAEKLPASMLPKWILVISDMQFDLADGGGYKSHHAILQDKFAKAGEDAVGEPYHLPRMIYWNTDDACVSDPVGADEVGTVLVSGYSPSMLKTFLSSASFDGVVTPFQSMKDVLNDVFYDDVRKVLERVREPPYFTDYIAPPRPATKTV